MKDPGGSSPADPSGSPESALDGATLDRLANRNSFTRPEHNRLSAMHDPPADTVLSPGCITGERLEVRVAAEVDVAHLGHGHR